MSYVYNPLLGAGLDQTGAGGGGGTPGGSDTQVQFNDGGSFGGDDGLTFNKTTNELTVGASTGDGGSAKVYGDINLDDGGSFTTTVQCVTPTANRTISFPNATGTVALVAGSSGQLTYNNAGSNAGLTSANIGSTGEINVSLAGAASTPPVTFTGSWFTGGTATTTKPQLLIEPTGTTSTAWSTSGTGLGVNAASGFGGNLLDLQVNGTSKAYVSKDAEIVAVGSSAKIGHNIGSSGGSAIINGGISIGNAARLFFSQTAPTGGDVAIARSGTNCIKVTNGSTGTGYIKQDPVLTVNLPDAATVGAGTRGFVSDASVTTFRGDPTPGTGTPSAATTVPVYSDGSNWLIG